MFSCRTAEERPPDPDGQGEARAGRHAARQLFHRAFKAACPGPLPRQRYSREYSEIFITYFILYYFLLLQLDIFTHYSVVVLHNTFLSAYI